MLARIEAEPRCFRDAFGECRHVTQAEIEPLRADRRHHVRGLGDERRARSVEPVSDLGLAVRVLLNLGLVVGLIYFPIGFLGYTSTLDWNGFILSTPKEIGDAILLQWLDLFMRRAKVDEK